MNTQQKHTAEPWAIISDAPNENHLIIIKNESRVVASVFADKRVNMPIEEANANAQRIVECVNACAGLTSEQLANIQELGATLLNRTLQIESLREDLAKRDKHIASLMEQNKTNEDIILASDKALKLWETTMMELLGEDGIGSVTHKIKELKLELSVTTKFKNDLYATRVKLEKEISDLKTVLNDTREARDAHFARVEVLEKQRHTINEKYQYLIGALTLRVKESWLFVWPSEIRQILKSHKQ